jgi:hypothetical protein
MGDAGGGGADFGDSDEVSRHGSIIRQFGAWLRYPQSETRAADEIQPIRKNSLVS